MPLRRLSLAASTSLGRRHRWRGRWRKRVACTRRPVRRDRVGTTTLNSSIPPSEPLNRHPGSMSTESSLQALKKVTVKLSGDTSNACIKTARTFLHWSRAHISLQTCIKSPSSWATSSVLSSLMTITLKQTICSKATVSPIRPLKVLEPGVRKLLRNLGKTAGPDEISVWILKELADDLSSACHYRPPQQVSWCWCSP